MNRTSDETDNALILLAEVDRSNELRLAPFAAQPPGGTGGFTTQDLVRLGAEIALTDPAFVSGVRVAR